MLSPVHSSIAVAIVAVATTMPLRAADPVGTAARPTAVGSITVATRPARSTRRSIKSMPTTPRILKLAWSWDSPDLPLQKENRSLGSFAYETTPLAVGNTLYISTSLAQVAAVDGRTGKIDLGFQSRSLQGRPADEPGLCASWRGLLDGRQRRRAHCTWPATTPICTRSTPRRAKRSSSFGEEGRVNLAKAIPLAVNARNYTMTSPPVICRDVVIVGSSISDGPQYKEAPRGDVQAFDVRTGKPAWIFHAIPQEGEFGNDTWEDESWKYTGNANVWTLMTTDDELGYVYLPMSTPTNDWYGGAAAGRWPVCRSAGLRRTPRPANGSGTIQTVHHGVWDYDLPGARCCAISRSTASRSRPWRKSRRPALRSSSIA